MAFGNFPYCVFLIVNFQTALNLSFIYCAVLHSNILCSTFYIHIHSVVLGKRYVELSCFAYIDKPSSPDFIHIYTYIYMRILLHFPLYFYEVASREPGPVLI